MQRDNDGSKREIKAIVIVMALVIVAFFALAGRCYYLQRDLGDYYAEKCIIQQRAYLPLEPQRGAILDARGRVLAASSQIRTIFAEPRIITEPKDTSNLLAPILDMGAHEICRLIVDSNNPGYVVLKKDATQAECEAAQKVLGIGVNYDWRRQYPTGRLVSHIVGFTSKDNYGLAGIEYAFDRDLRGRGAKHTFLVDVRRRPLGFCMADEQDDNETAIHGAGMILTLDATIQQFAREALQAQIKEFEAESGVVMVADPYTGEILAMVTLPDFDPADVAKVAQKHPEVFTNRLLTDQYEPGSIIKPVIAAIALDAKVVNKYETIFCENGNYHGKGFGHIGEYKKGFGDLTVREILMNSSNIGMAKIGQRLGATRCYEGLTLFGFGRKVGIELPGEAEGKLRPPSDWTGYSVTRIPFGQEISVTGLQMLRAFCMLANGGHLVHPYIVKSLVRSDGMVVDMRPSTLRVGYVIKPDVAKWMVQDAMTAVVNAPKGTGARAKLAKWTVFGKTGTAQLANPNGPGYLDKAYVSSFIAGAPASNPRIVVLVSIRRVNVALKKGYTGGTVAAPVAASILEKTLTYLGVPEEGSAEAAAATPRTVQAYSEENDENSW
ncbi:MAG: peptidoglycan D,D-transpeptidase FtsI family protein [Solirubrobacterales bacterium]